MELKSKIELGCSTCTRTVELDIAEVGKDETVFGHLCPVTREFVGSSGHEAILINGEKTCEELHF